MARFNGGEHPVESETMVTYKRCTVDVAERKAFIKLCKSLCETHLEHQFPQASLADALEATAELLQHSATLHLEEVRVGIITPLHQVQQLAELLVTMAIDFVEGACSPTRSGPSGFAERLLRGAGDNNVRTSLIATRRLPCTAEVDAAHVPSMHPTSTPLRMRAGNEVEFKVSEASEGAFRQKS